MTRGSIPVAFHQPGSLPTRYAADRPALAGFWASPHAPPARPWRFRTAATARERADARPAQASRSVINRGCRPPLDRQDRKHRQVSRLEVDDALSIAEQVVL